MSATPNTSTVLRAYIQLCRPLNAIMAGVSTLIGYLLAVGISHAVWDTNLLFTLLAVIFIISGGQAINDYFDRDLDAKQKKSRPIPSGAISPQHALIFALALFVVGNLLAWQVQSTTALTFPIAFYFSLLLIAYSAFMRRIKFVGNIIVALGVGFTYIFGASITHITPLVLAIALAAFLANWVREIMKDVEDKEMDRGNKLTLPLITNPRNVSIIASIILLLALIAGYVPQFFFGAGVAYVLLITAANLVFILAVKKLWKNDAKKAASLMKKGMLIALVAQLSLLLF
jgi:geranylgeranylglycerol-phosphate geranylgeranyltransferase